MRSLKTVQTLSKVGKILSKIVFICCIVGFCLCVVGIVSLALGIETVKFGDFTLKGFIEKNEDISIGTLYTAMALGVVFCAAEAVLAKFAERYFKRELADGTPFTKDGANEMQRLGILAICIPVGAAIVAGIVRVILEHTLTDVKLPDVGSFGSIALGIMFIVTAQICKYGAELKEEKTEVEKTDEE